MTTPVTGSPAGEPAAYPLVGQERDQQAFREPSESVPMTWVALLVLANLGLWAGFFGPIQVLLGQQAMAISEPDKEFIFGLVTGIGALVSTVMNPLWGAFSDRTTLRIGRRVPWVAGGAAFGALSLVVLSLPGGSAMAGVSVPLQVLAMTLGWSGVQLGLNAMLAAITAVIPDQVPVRQRGIVGGLYAVAQTVGVVGGVGIAAATGSIAAGYLTTAAVVVLFALPYLARNRDIALPPGAQEPFALGAFVRSFWISPRAHPDFGWAWITRFLANLGNALGTLYLLFFLTDAVQHPAPDQGVFVLTAIYAACLIVASVIGGLLSDRLGRRRPFVVVSGTVAGAAALILAFVQTWPGAILGAIVLGLGYGIYTSVDFALITQVLPSAHARGKDLGVINIANALPQVLAPFLATVLLVVGRSLGGVHTGYLLLYVFSFVMSLLGAVLVNKIRSVA